MFTRMSGVFTYIYFTIRPILKWLLHRFTRLCELQRLCYGAASGAKMTRAVENSLNWSRTREIKALVHRCDTLVAMRPLTDEEFIGGVTEPAVDTVMRVKRIKAKVHPDFGRLFETCVERIWGYKRLYFMVEAMRTTPFDSDRADHEAKLLELWQLLMPETKLESRITKQWQDIGFQGDDPKTDFRGMGILGLENLLFFATEYREAARHVLSHSLHPKHGYTFAIVGINLTSMSYKLLKSGRAKTHIFNAVPSYPSINAFHHLYCYLFYEFDRFWMLSKPQSIMDFSFIQEKFEASVNSLLSHDSTQLQINLAVDNI